MSLTFFDILRAIVALGGGAVIGLGFGTLQQVARHKNEQREARGQLTNGWSLMPGAGVRVAYLLVTLAAVQFICPLFFVDGTQWFVSGGLLAGYAWTLAVQLRLRAKAGER